MIKVNLIADHHQRSRKKVSVKPTVSRLGLLFAAVLIVTAGALGVYWSLLSREITTLTANKQRLTIENAKLQELKKKLKEYESLKQVRENRIDVIEKLKDFQTGPVLLLNHVIASIPRDSQMWLTQLDQKGDRVKIAGMAPRSDMIPDFMSNLSTGGLFKSVELELIQEDKEAAKFSLLCFTSRKPESE
jgi:Tfp pilus assembly protein PilN